MNQVRALLHPIGRAFLLTGTVSGMLLMAGYSPAGEGSDVNAAQSLPQREWAAQAAPLEPARSLVDQQAPVQRWVF